MLIVQKFGGSSLATISLIKTIAKRIISHCHSHENKLVVVLSAQGDTTDELIEKALVINPKPSKREMDMLLSTGEQQSVALMTLAIHQLGYPAVSLNCIQAGIHSDNNYGNARIQSINPQRIISELDKNNIVIVTGFQGFNLANDIVTLGRGGSDTSAVALSIALNADVCEIYTDVDGIYTADPRIISNTRKLNAISYDEMLELSALGAVVLHNRAVELAKKYNMKLTVRSSFDDSYGTEIGDVDKMEQSLVSGIAIDKHVAVISVIGVPDEPGMVFRLFALLARRNIAIDLIIQSIGRQNTKDISFTVNELSLDETVQLLEDNNDFVRYDHIIYNKDVAKLSIVGAGMASNPKIAMQMFEAIYNCGINVKMISTSEIKISILVDEKDASQAAQTVHDAFL